MKILLLLALLQHPDARPTVPAPVGKQERTVFYDAQHKHCAVLTEREAGYWYAYLDRNNEVSPGFHTRAGHPEEGRAEAVKWISLHGCAVPK